ncbi:hypothetical protein [uncultured Clostridium sp.]|uniref:hypothetical protein n=1 Tax=uncultured Clostridium sp. TaxID=59620 RepID=UPI002608D056|nr:hypothetical protein [uncultured Clostridium sp.]
MGENNTKNKGDNSKEKITDYSYYFPICLGLGVVFGVLFNQISTGLCLGTVVGLSLDYEKGKKEK